MTETPTGPDPILLAEHTWQEVAGFVEEDRRVIIPLGSTEAHGPHLPLDVDTHSADTVARQLAGRIGISLPACTRLVDRMKDEGMVLRERDASDRRVVNGKLSAASRRHVENIDRAMTAKLEIILSRVEAADRQTFVDLHEKLVGASQHKMAEVESAQ